MSSPQEIAMRLLEGGGSAPSEEWQPPSDWLEVPEPGEWEACFLIEIRNKFTFSLNFYNPQNSGPGNGTVIIDWGDGTVETFVGSVPDENGFEWTDRRPTNNTHTYAKAGQYIVKATVDELSCFLYKARDANYDTYNVNLLVAKTGEKICLDKYEGSEAAGSLGYNCRLHWAKVNGSSKMQEAAFEYCASLKRLDFAVPMTSIPKYGFLYATIPDNFDFSKITSIKNSGFSHTNLPKKLFLPECIEIESYGLNLCGIEEIYAPKCTSVGSYALANDYWLRNFSAPACENVADHAFAYCYALETAEFSDDCVYGTNCFYNCFSLYPRPDGSTN